MPASRARSTALLSRRRRNAARRADQRAGQRHGIGIAAQSGPLDRRAAGKAQARAIWRSCRTLRPPHRRSWSRAGDSRRRRGLRATGNGRPRRAAAYRGIARSGSVSRGDSAWPSRWLTAISGLPVAAPAPCRSQADHHAADQARAGGGGDRVDLGERHAGLGQHAFDQRDQPSTWARAAISGTTPP
jgi:hypothetical protein